MYILIKLRIREMDGGTRENTVQIQCINLTLRKGRRQRVSVIHRFMSVVKKIKIFMLLAERRKKQHLLINMYQS